MSIDQQIQIWNAVGTWLAAIGTLAAVIFALYTSRRATTQDLFISIGIRRLLPGNEEYVCFNVTNKGLNPVTIINVGWKVGRWKRKQYAIQMIDRTVAAVIPKELAHGQNATFMFSLTAHDWLETTSKDFIDRSGDHDLSTMKGLVATSLQEFWRKPEKSLIERLKAAYKP